MTKESQTAVAYFRTSSATNVGADKDSEKRQRAAVETYAKQASFEIVDAFYDAAVSGAAPVDARPGFAEMIERLMGNGARTILVESQTGSPAISSSRRRASGSCKAWA
jgi:DNA invertase Pin-like site-specific DNA recombinase